MLSAPSIMAEGDFPSHNDTVYLAAVDEEGLAVSFINSLFDSIWFGDFNASIWSAVSVARAGF